VVDVGTTVDRIDTFQQRHRWAGVAFAVYKKFSEDQAGNLAALISYYAFFSIFPLLLALTTVLGFVLAGHPALETRIYDGAVGNLPIIGQNSRQHPLTGSVFGLVFGLLLAIWSGLAVAQQAQTAFNVVWNIARVDRPGFVPRLVRSLELVAVVGGGLILTTLVQGAVSGSSVYGLHLGVGIDVLAAVVGIVLDVGLLVLLFRRGTGRPLTPRQVLPGAVVGGIGWFVLQKLATHLVNSKVHGASGTYGTFAAVIGLLSYFYLLAQVTLYAAELNVVLAERLWPRGLRALTGKATTEADERAYSAYPERERQAHGTDVDVDVDTRADSDRERDPDSDREQHPDSDREQHPDSDRRGNPDRRPGPPGVGTAPGPAERVDAVDGAHGPDDPPGVDGGRRDLSAGIRRLQERRARR